MSLYFISPGKYVVLLEDKPLNCSGELLISETSINNLSAINPHSWLIG